MHTWEKILAKSGSVWPHALQNCVPEEESFCRGLNDVWAHVCPCTYVAWVSECRIEKNTAPLDCALSRIPIHRRMYKYTSIYSYFTGLRKRISSSKWNKDDFILFLSTRHATLLLTSFSKKKKFLMFHATPNHYLFIDTNRRQTPCLWKKKMWKRTRLSIWFLLLPVSYIFVSY